MPMNLTLSSNGVGADISTVNIPFGQASTTYNNHVAGLADLHDSTQIADGSLAESTTITNAASTTHARLDMIFAMLSGILGGSGNASTRYAARSTDLTSLAATVAGASATGASLTIPRRDANGGMTLGTGLLSGTAILGVVNTLATAFPVYIINAVGQSVASLLIRDSTGTINHFFVDAAGNMFTLGTITAGSGSVAVTDAAGHVLSAALNTVSPTQGGTGVSNPTAGYVKAAGGATAMGTVATIPVGDGGTGQTSYTNGQLLIGNTTGGTLAKGTITATGGIVVTNGAGTIALSTSGLAASGANGDITSLTGLTTPLTVAQGGTGGSSQAAAQAALGVPSATGAGASGIWAVSITGTAAIADGSVTASKVAAGSISRSHIADGLAQAQTTPDKTVKLAGSYTYPNASGVQKTVGGNSPAYDAVNSLPSGSNLRVDLLYADDTGALAWKAGTPALSSPQDPPRDAGTWPIAYVGPITSAGPVITSGMIRDARPSPTAGNGSGSGGGGTDLSAKPFFTYHTDGTLTAEMDWFTWADGTTNTAPDATDLSGKRIDPTRVTPSTPGTSATLLDMLHDYIPPDIPARISKSATNQMQVLAGVVGTTPGPAKIGVNGRWKVNTITVFATASGAAGPRYVIADTNPTSPPAGEEWSIISPMPSSSVTTANQELLMTVWWDGTTIQDGILDLTPLLNLSSLQTTMLTMAATNSANDTIATPFNSTPAKPTNMGVSQDFYLPVSMRARIRQSCFMLTNVASAAGQYMFSDVGFAFNGGAYTTLSADPRIIVGTTAISTYRKDSAWGDVTLGAGRWSFTQTVGYTGPNTDTTSNLLLARRVEVDLYRG